MSPRASIAKRRVKGGWGCIVRFRLGGRETQPRHAGSFRTRKAEARAAGSDHRTRQRRSGIHRDTLGVRAR